MSPLPDQHPDFMMMYRTFSAVFPDNQVWAVSDGGDILFVGFKSENHADVTQVEARVAQELRNRGLEGQVSLSRFGAQQTMTESLEDSSVPLNTDDRPVLQFRVLRNVVEWNALH